jgi:chromosome segregation ATPase
MTDYSGLVHRLRTEWDDVEIDCEAADAIEAQAKQIEKLDDTRIEYIGMINKLVDEREELKKVLKVADEKIERLEKHMDRVQNLIDFFYADIHEFALCKDKK